MLDFGFRYAITLTVGGLDLSSCLKSISWQLPLHEPEQKLAWTGSLSLGLSSQAEQAGVLPSDLDPLLAQQRWSPGVSEVLLSIPELNVGLSFRLSDWKWDRNSYQGSGTLAQQIDLYDVAIPELDPEVVYLTPAAGQKLGDVTARLLSEVQARASVQMPVSLSITNEMPNEVVWGSRATRNPMAELQTFARTGWRWLCQELSGSKQVTVKSLDYQSDSSSPVLFARPLSEAQVEPSQSSVSFAAPKVIAHGGADLPDPCPGDDGSGANANGRQKELITELTEPAGKIFPELGLASTPYVSQRKTVLKSWVTDSTYVNNTEFYPVYSPPRPISEDGLFRVETIIEEPAGKIFPELGTVLTLRTSGRIIETAEWKANYKPRGLIYEEAGPIFTMELESLERLGSPYVPPGGSTSGKLSDGSHGCIDKAAPEVPEAKAIKLKPQLFRGEAALVQTFLPALNYPYVHNIGFCPSQTSADLTAQRLAVREPARKYADEVTIAMPIEWLQSGCRHFFRAHIGTKVYWADGVRAEIAADESGRISAGMKFTGLPMAEAAEVLQVLPLPYDPSLALPGLAEQPTASWPASIATTAGVAFTIQL